MGAYINQFRPRLHLTLEEAAKRFGVTPQHLATAIRHHQLRGRRLAHRTWVTCTAVSSYLEQERRRAEWGQEAKTA